MLSKRYKLFSDISLGIVIFYFAINFIMYCSFKITDIPDSLFFLIDNVFLPIDLFTWHVFGLFAVVSFLVKLGLGNLRIKANLVKALTHIALTIPTFYFIYYIFENSF